MIHIADFLRPVDYAWYELGEALYVDNQILQGLRRSNNTNIGKLHRVIDEWLKLFPDACWVEVIDAVEGPLLSNRRVAMDILDHLKKPEIEAEYVSRYNEWNK